MYIIYISNTIAKRFRLFWESYLPTIWAKITGPLGTIFWILSAVWRSEIAFIALLIHLVPIPVHYFRCRPFAVQFDYTPIRADNGNPDLLAAEDGEAIIHDGRCEIHGKVKLMPGTNSFKIQFETDDTIAAELRDIPKPEHIYDRDKNILLANEVHNQRFTLILDIFDYGKSEVDSTCLRIKDIDSNSYISEIKLIRGS